MGNGIRPDMLGRADSYKAKKAFLESVLASFRSGSLQKKTRRRWNDRRVSSFLPQYCRKSLSAQLSHKLNRRQDCDPDGDCCAEIRLKTTYVISTPTS